jgi:hypothetical protein
VHPGVEHLRGPGGEAVVELVQAGDAGLAGLQHEALADHPVEPFLLASALG